ncbi:hypothetical protein LQQ63_26390 (plasmid) [Escherichia coli]|nr:hypothetical protein LQQ63_26390 [Escherichia coli]
MAKKSMLATDSSTFAEDVTATLRCIFLVEISVCKPEKQPEPEVEAFTNQPKKMVKKNTTA